MPEYFMTNEQIAGLWLCLRKSIPPKKETLDDGFVIAFLFYFILFHIHFMFYSFYYCFFVLSLIFYNNKTLCISTNFLIYFNLY